MECKLTFIKSIDRQYGLYKCECGNKKKILNRLVKSRNTKSCGCLRKKIARENGKKSAKHNLRYSEEYNTWRAMKSRCLNPKDPSYKNYGGRGIKIYDKWINSFVEFYNDVGPQPTPEHTLDRKDNNGDYTPENCKWSTGKEQSNKKRNNIIINYNNETYTQTQLCEKYNIKVTTFKDRLKRGLTIEEALTLPLHPGKRIKK